MRGRVSLLSRTTSKSGPRISSHAKVSKYESACKSIRTASLLEITIDQLQNYQTLKDLDDIRRRLLTTVKAARLAFHLVTGDETLDFTERYIEQHKLPPPLVEIRLQEQGSTFQNVSIEKSVHVLRKNAESYGKIMKFVARYNCVIERCV